MTDEDEFLIVSADCFQCVRILLPHSQVMSHTILMKSLGYVLSHINALSRSKDVLFNLVWKRPKVGLKNRVEYLYGYNCG